MTTKTDVYSFGVVLLELFMGLAADDPTLKQQTLVKGEGCGVWVWLANVAYLEYNGEVGTCVQEHTHMHTHTHTHIHTQEVHWVVS